MRIISTSDIGQKVKELFLSTAFILPDEVKVDLNRAIADEPSPQGRTVLEHLKKNSELAATSLLPLCQDTGLAQVILEIGQNIFLDGLPLYQTVENKVREAYQEGHLRKSTCQAITRQNFGDNTPISLETIIVPGDSLTIHTLAKGGGCDNKSRLFNLTPTTSREQIIESIYEAVLAAGPDACPPFYLGICIGGSFESAPRLARRALFELWHGPEMTEDESHLTDDLILAINQSGLGPMGQGGRTTTLGLRVKIYPAHIASLPVAVNLNCHSLRLGHLVL